MPLSGELFSQPISDSTYHQVNMVDSCFKHANEIQSSYVFSPSTSLDDEERKPRKRLKLSKPRISNGSRDRLNIDDNSLFPPLLNGVEKLEFVELRQHLYEVSWAAAEAKIEVIKESTWLKVFAD
jgi:hypothetical protein